MDANTRRNTLSIYVFSGVGGGGVSVEWVRVSEGVLYGAGSVRGWLNGAGSVWGRGHRRGGIVRW